MSPTTLREAGAVLLALAGWLGGQLAGEPYRRRVAELRAWRVVLERLEAEVAWDGRPLGDAMRRAAAGVEGGAPAAVLRFAAACEASRGATGGLWREAVESAPWLDPHDRAALLDLAAVIGRHSRGDQVRQLRGAASRVGERLEEARQRDRQEGRMWRTLVALAAIGLAVLLV
jgi:stage III sporulation protein AB